MGFRGERKLSSMVKTLNPAHSYPRTEFELKSKSILNDVKPNLSDHRRLKQKRKACVQCAKESFHQVF